ncbi:MAG: glycoside hydrolase family 5 protein [Candidatus Lokiarchaeota archaeon]|nr:glycoside hydrolase family 5 protein [Candidatus Lokiarchaeota archaeon]
MKLIGLNLGGFFSQVDEYTEEHLNNFIREDDIKQINNWNFNCIRLPIDFNFFEIQKEEYKYREDRIKRIENVLTWTQKYNMTLIFDLHKAPGHTFEAREDRENTIWNIESENRKRFLRIWDYLAERFKDQENIIYEILNEPVAKKEDLWYKLAKDAIKVIRNRDEKHEIIIESNLWGKTDCFNSMPLFKDDKIIYSFHYYQPHWVTHQTAEWIAFYIKDIHRKKEYYPGKIEIPPDKYNMLGDNFYLQRFKEEHGYYWDKEKMLSTIQPVLDFREKYDVPIFCGEFGIIAKADPEVRKNWIEDLMAIMRENKISYTYWTYKNMDFGLFDFTEKYKNNQNYQNERRLDEITLKAIQNGTF